MGQTRPSLGSNVVRNAPIGLQMAQERYRATRAERLDFNHNRFFSSDAIEYGNVIVSRNAYPFLAKGFDPDSNVLSDYSGERRVCL